MIISREWHDNSYCGNPMVTVVITVVTVNFYCVSYALRGIVIPPPSPLPSPRCWQSWVMSSIVNHRVQVEQSSASWPITRGCGPCTPPTTSARSNAVHGSCLCCMGVCRCTTYCHQHCAPRQGCQVFFAAYCQPQWISLPTSAKICQLSDP